MKISHKGLLDIIGHEGVVRRGYKDSQGVWTIGVGHTAAAGFPDPLRINQNISLDEVMEILARDLAKFEARVTRYVKEPLAQHEFDALVSFDFNTGGIGRAKLVDHLNRGDRAAAARGFMGWRRPPEIVPRRRAEQALFRDGVYSNLEGVATEYPADERGRVKFRKGFRVALPLLPSTDSPAPVELPSEPAPQAAPVPRPKPAVKPAPKPAEKPARVVVPKSAPPLLKSKSGFFSVILAALGGILSSVGDMSPNSQLLLVGGGVVGVIGFYLLARHDRLSGKRVDPAAGTPTKFLPEEVQ